MLSRTRHTVSGLLLCGILLAGCQSKDNESYDSEETARADIPANITPDASGEWTLGCNNGQTLTVTFDHPRDMATVHRSDGLAFDLVRKPVSSGYLYSASPVELRGEGKVARWDAPPVSTTDCQVTQVTPRN